MGYRCSLQCRTRRPAVSIRFRADAARLPRLTQRALARLQAYLARAGARSAGPQFTAYLAAAAGRLEVEVGVATDRELAGEGFIHPTHLPGGQLATCLVEGPRFDAAPAYRALGRWVTRHRLRLDGAPLELYLDELSAPEQRHRTELVFPVASAQPASAGPASRRPASAEPASRRPASEDS